MATLKELESALVRADKAGDADSARKLAAVIRRERARREKDPSIGLIEQIPDGGPTHVPGTVPGRPEPTIGERAAGVGEAALTTVSGATTGALGMIAGTLRGLAREIASGEFGSYSAADRVEQEAMKGMQAGTYTPTTEEGQQYVKAVGETLEPLVAVAPMAGEMQALGTSTRMAVPAARALAEQQVVKPTTRAVQTAIERTRQMATRPDIPGTAPSAGAGGTDIAAMRQAQAEQLPVPMKLTEGQKTRSFEAQRFERETAKLPEEGSPLRERFTQQNEQLVQNMDAFIDETGAKLGEGNLRGIGELVDETLRSRASKDKARIRTLYKEAEKAGDMEEPIDLQGVVDVLEESRSAESTAPVIGAARKELSRLLGLEEGATPETPVLRLKETEQLRKFINKVAGADPTNIKFASDIKKAIDTATEGKGGKKYKLARSARAKYAQEYENAGLVKRLLNTKRGTDDRAIAMEDVLRKVVLDPSTSLDQMRQVRRLLQTKTGGREGPGAQAWREVQSGVLNHIKEQMTKGVSRDQAGNPIVSPAQLDRVITQLDRSGKLDFVFGKKGAEQLRTINEVAKDVLTSPPGTVNTSNTATVLAGLMDVAVTGMTGVPTPIVTGFRFISNSVKDKKLKARIKQSLGE